MNKPEQTGGRPMRYSLAMLLRMTSGLLSRVRRCNGGVKSTSVSSGNLRVAVGSRTGADAGAVDGYMAFIDARDKSTSKYNVLRAAFGATAEEALMNLEKGLKQEAGRGTP